MAKKMAMERKIDAIVDKLDRLDAKVSTLDSKVMQLDGKVTQLDGKVTHLDGKVTRLDGGVRDLKNEMKIQFEQTRDKLKFGLEAREGLRETMEGSFAAMDRKHDQEIGLLKGVLRDLAPRRRARRRG